jgi:hypothetical protein
MGGIKFVLLAPSMLVFCLFHGELFRLRLPFDMSHVFQAGALFVSGHLSCLATWRRSITKLRLIDDRLSLSGYAPRGDRRIGVAWLLGLNYYDNKSILMRI